MKQKNRTPRLLRAAACAALAAALVCGCTLQTASPAEVQAGGAGLAYDASILDDGVLRVFYGQYGMTVLCGSKVLYQGSVTDTVTLAEDEVTGETNYYLVDCNRADVPGGRTTLLYDRTGALVYDCGADSIVSLVNGKLLIRTVEYGMEADDAMMRNYEYRLLDLATGEEQPMPAVANNWFSDGAGRLLAVTQTSVERPAGLTVDAGGPEEWVSYSQMCYRSTTTVYDSDLQPVARLEHCRGYQTYNGWLSGNLTGWVALDFGETDEQDGAIQTRLYCPATGEMIDNYVSICGSGLVCTGTEETGYQVRRLGSGEVLGEYSAPCELYLPELTLMWQSSSGTGNYGYYAVFADDPGHALRTRFDYSGGTVALLLEDEELRVYDTEQQAAPLLRTKVELPEGTYGAVLSAAENGYVWLSCYDQDYNTLDTQVYGPQGLVYSTADKEYDSFYYLTADAEKGPLFAVGYGGPGDAPLTDVIDVNGNVLCQGLGYAYHGYNVPEGCFNARRGFTVGWMTADGEWAYCESMFRTMDAEDGPNYLW